ncbi:hypothetical protein [Myroides sp. TSA_177.3]|uniref:hypothetical protein n=1 Tax=Myroides sp. TSA_177.3 TaxID=3415650 RepID=UPI0040452723
MKDIAQRLGENSPYLFPLNSLVIQDTTLEYTESIALSNSFEAFYKVLQIASSLGSIALLQKMDVVSKTFFLGEKLRIRKIPQGEISDELKYQAESLLFSERKGKSLVNIFDQHQQLAYTFELDYIIFTEDSFQRVFKSFYTAELALNTPVEFRNEVTVTPLCSSHFQVIIQAFSAEQCAGHFDHYPIVPAVFIVNRLLSAIETFFKMQDTSLSTKTLIVDSLEIFPNTATPPNTDLHAHVYYRQITKNNYLFVCPIHDSQTEYGNYIITIKLQ